MARARIALISGFDHSYSTETHLAADARALGCDVGCVNEREVSKALQLGEPIRIRDIDLVLYMKHHGLPHNARTLWGELEELGIRTASYHLDLYAGLDREGEIGVDPFWHTGTVFTADGSATMRAMCSTLGINHRWMPAAIVSDEAHRGQFDPTLARDVVFVGKVEGYHQQWPWRRELVEALHHRYGKRFRVWNHNDKPAMRGQRLNDLYASAKVVVGDTLALPAADHYWSDRYYETIGRGGCLVAPWVEGIDSQLTDGLHFHSYLPGDTTTLCRKVDYLLDHPSERNKVTGLGIAHVRAHHTYKHRIEQILTEVGL